MSDLREQFSHPAGLEFFEKGEFIEWGRGRLGTSLIWSSILKLPELLAEIEAAVGPVDSAQRGVVDFGDTQSEPTTAQIARERALANPDGVTFLRLEFGEKLAVVWTPTPGLEEMPEETKGYAEMSVFFTPETIAIAALTMEKTATEHLVPFADTVTQSVVAA